MGEDKHHPPFLILFFMKLSKEELLVFLQIQEQGRGLSKRSALGLYEVTVDDLIYTFTKTIFSRRTCELFVYDVFRYCIVTEEMCNCINSYIPEFMKDSRVIKVLSENPRYFRRRDEVLENLSKVIGAKIDGDIISIITSCIFSSLMYIDCSNMELHKTVVYNSLNLKELRANLKDKMDECSLIKFEVNDLLYLPYQSEIDKKRTLELSSENIDIIKLPNMKQVRIWRRNS